MVSSSGLLWAETAAQASRDSAEIGREAPDSMLQANLDDKAPSGSWYLLLPDVNPSRSYGRRPRFHDTSGGPFNGIEHGTGGTAGTHLSRNPVPRIAPEPADPIQLISYALCP